MADTMDLPVAIPPVSPITFTVNLQMIHLQQLSGYSHNRPPGGLSTSICQPIFEGFLFENHLLLTGCALP
jgi:hypothetical protein